LERGTCVFGEGGFPLSAAFAELAAVLDEHLTRWQKHGAAE